ncbi:DUF4123 domain-containing protein [Marinobacter aromaticivorans]|uniref:DUF4123 domain-containing protein n=1 Tax=Marinobacter aromaticivorans TaxID=1494078 RepID=A0ABW2IYE0_9GAMM|nr:DUF4123 domain-containing protein [Marinobacter aromaticivorans]
MTDITALSREAHRTTSFFHHTDPFKADASWYLVDQARHPEALRLLFEHDPAPVYELPYIHSEYRGHAYSGPLLIQPVTRQSEEWLHSWLTEGKALALYGPPLAPEAICNHLVGLNTIRAIYGDSLFRYADPATLGSLGASLSLHQRLRVLGPLTAIHGHYGGTNWSLVNSEGPVPSNGSDEQLKTPLVLTQENLAAMEHYRQNVLAESLARSNGLADEVVSFWFQQLITLGAPNEQALAEGVELLAKQGFTGVLSEDGLATVRKTRQGANWSDTLEALAALAHSQEGT